MARRRRSLVGKTTLGGIPMPAVHKAPEPDAHTTEETGAEGGAVEDDLDPQPPVRGTQETLVPEPDPEPAADAGGRPVPDTLPIPPKPQPNYVSYDEEPGQGPEPGYDEGPGRRDEPITPAPVPRSEHPAHDGEDPAVEGELGPRDELLGVTTPVDAAGGMYALPPPSDPKVDLPPSFSTGDGFAEDLFGDTGDEPPTEEMPAAVLEDLSQMYSAPMNVPEPPPLPGILDRYTPAMPVQRSYSQGTPAKESDRPSYIDTPTPAPKVGTGIGDSPYFQDAREKTEPAEDAEAEGGGSPSRTFIVVAGGLLVVAVAIFLLGGLVLAGLYAADGLRGGSQSSTVVPTPPPTTPGRLGAGNGVTVEDGVGIEDTDTDADTDATGEEPLPGESSDPTPAVAPATPPKPRPVRRPKKPEIAPPLKPRTIEPTAPQANQGTIKVRAVQRTLIYLNGKAIGYTPIDLAKPPGQYQISTQPSGEDARSVTVIAGDIVPVQF